MKTIYTIYLSEDGLYGAYSNKKALFNAIMNGNFYTHCRFIETSYGVYKPLTYSNLVSQMSKSSYIKVTDGNIHCYGTIVIEPLTLYSK